MRGCEDVSWIIEERENEVKYGRDWQSRNNLYTICLDRYFWIEQKNVMEISKIYTDHDWEIKGKCCFSHFHHCKKNQKSATGWQAVHMI